MRERAIAVTRPPAFTTEQMPWGHLVWQVSGSLGNSDEMTLGRCVLEPGQANGRHFHPNCDELLEVLDGSIVHTWDAEEVAMERGDIISVPAGVVHNARNVGEGRANLLICFSSAWRETTPVQ
jgi:quercetin dioxygenase-like cupin family protein